MGRSVEEIIAELPPERQRKIKARAAELIAEEMTLRELRKAMGRTQAQIAKATGKPQATISRMEAQSDMLLSNLDRVVGAMGGRVRLMAELPGRAPVFLTGLGDLSPSETPAAEDAPKKRARAKPSSRTPSTTAERGRRVDHDPR